MTDQPSKRSPANRDGDDEIVVAEGEFTFVALDETDKPRAIAERKGSNG